MPCMFDLHCHRRGGDAIATYRVLVICVRADALVAHVRIDRRAREINKKSESPELNRICFLIHDLVLDF